MDSLARKTILSGIQPIDQLMGGLDIGQLYLVHGESPGTSLCAIIFLIEGLKRGEHCALVVSCSPEDAVSRFAQVGYHCVEDIFGGRLVIIECSDEMIEQISRPGHLKPALRELEWLLGETRPRRLVFDPVTNVLAGEKFQIEARVAEFAQWIKSLDATALFIEQAGNPEVIRLLKLHVAESFRFEARESAGRATEFIVFEKSPSLADQAVEVDPSGGVFWSDRAQAPWPPGAPFFSAPGPDIRLVDLDVQPQKQQEPTTISGPETRTSDERQDYTGAGANETSFELDLEGIEDALARLVEIKNQPAVNGPQPPVHETSSRLLQHPTDSHSEEVTDRSDIDLALELFGDLGSVFIADDPGANQVIPHQSGDALPPATESSGQSPEPLPRPTTETWKAAASPLSTGSRQATRAESAAASFPARTGKRASDIRINAAMTARAVETLLGPEKLQETQPASATPAVMQAPAPDAQESVDPKSFRVLLIDDEAESCEMIVQSLSDFTIEKIHDGVSGLAKLISYKPDLVVLDLDLNIMDGFKLLAHIRARLNVPVIIISSELLRSTEGLRPPDPEPDAGVNQLAKALAASGYYHLTTEFSTKQLTQKARQLIARYRGIESWITQLSARSSERPPSIESPGSPTAAQPLPAETHAEGFMPYDKFVEEVEKRVKVVIDNGSALSVVGCRVPQMTTANGNTTHSILLDAVRRLVRDTDLASTNMPGDVVVLLADARASGARAFAVRLRDTLAQKLNQEPSVWMRTFPGPEEASEATVLPASPTNGARHRRRATD